MIVPDVNVLVYAAHRTSPHHDAAHRWWLGTVNAGTPIGLPWVVAAGFLRVATNPRAFANPYPVIDAMDLVEGWYSLPNVTAIGPGRRHVAVLRSFLEHLGRGANAVPDAHLAAIAAEHGAALCSSDRGFASYPGLRWVDPLAL